VDITVRVETNQPPEALRQAAESAAHSGDLRSSRLTTDLAPLMGASLGTSSGCGTQATENVRNPPPSGSAAGALWPRGREAPSLPPLPPSPSLQLLPNPKSPPRSPPSPPSRPVALLPPHLKWAPRSVLPVVSHLY
jgi:hypothetical protein